MRGVAPGTAEVTAGREEAGLVAGVIDSSPAARRGPKRAEGVDGDGQGGSAVGQVDAPGHVALETRLIDIPLVRPHKFSVATMNRQGVLLIRLVTEDGIVGWGEGVVPGGPW